MTQQTSKTTHKPKKEFYVSLNREELAALETLGFRERWTYIVFKTVSDLKTGVLGEFREEKQSFTKLAGLIKPPPGVQGRGEGKIDDTQVRDFIERMEAVGLVSGRGRRGNGGLRFDLPMSPIDRAKAKLVLASTGKNPSISPTEAANEIAATPAPARVDEALPSSLSVVINKEKNINTEEAAEPSADGAASCRASGANPCRAGGAAALRENPRAVAAVAAPLTAEEIHDAVAGSWTFIDVDTEEAWQLYRSWEGVITLDALHAAMVSVEESEGCPDPRPMDLRKHLWPLVVDYNLGQLSA